MHRNHDANDATEGNAAPLIERLFSLTEAVTSESSPLKGRVCTRTLSKLVRDGQMPGVVRIKSRSYLTLGGIREFIANGGAK